MMEGAKVTVEESAMDPAAEIGAIPRLRRATLDQLVEMIGRETVRGFIEEYFVEAQRQMAEMRTRWSANDYDGVYRPAHNLVSTSGNFGVARVSRLADLVQRACRDQEAEVIGPLLDLLAAEIDASSAELRGLFEDNG